MTPLEKGTAIGRYEVIELLSSNEYSSCYLSQDKVLDRLVAVYILDSTKDNELLERYQRGIELIAKLQHPNVVGIHDAGWFESRPFHVLDFIDGRLLSNLIPETVGLSQQVALSLASSVASALAYLHHRGFVHRSILPNNIVVGKSTGEPVIVDFGISDPVASHELPHREDARDWISTSPHLVSPLVDLRGLGITLLMMLCGRRVRTVPVPELRSHLLSNLESYGRDLPPYITECVRNCLTADGSVGFCDAEEAKQALEAALNELDMAVSDTVVDALPASGQTILLHIENREERQPGTYRLYQLEDHISEGAFGDIYRARNNFNDQLVALKILKPKWLSNRNAIERFRREALIVARLTHPNIVTVYNFGRFGKSFFIAMEYLLGPTLQEIGEEAGEMDVKRALSLMKPVLQALSAVQQAGIVHRDLKPENIKVCEGRVVLFDFGISHLEGLEELTKTGVFVGTVSYAAPEQAKNQPITSATDIYAVGVILYELLTRRLPFQAESTIALLFQIAHEAPTPVNRYRTDLPEQVTRLLEAMLSADPLQRPSALEALEMIENLQ